MTVRNKFAFWSIKTWFPTERILNKLILDRLYPHKIKIQESLRFNLIATVCLSQKHHFRAEIPSKLKARGAAPGLRPSSLQPSIFSFPLSLHLSSFSNGTEKLKHPFKHSGYPQLCFFLEIYATFWLPTRNSRSQRLTSAVALVKHWGKHLEMSWARSGARWTSLSEIHCPQNHCQYLPSFFLRDGCHKLSLHTRATEGKFITHN